MQSPKMRKLDFLSVFPLHVMLMLATCLATAQAVTTGFTDATSEAGIDFLYNFGDTSYENILESSGSGITVFDYNNDGFMDIYLLSGTYLPGISDETGRKFEGSGNSMYENKGDGTFRNVSKASGLDDRNWGMAAAPVDIDRDGYQDLYLLNYGENVFLRNNGDGTFADLTNELGLPGPKKLNGFVKWSIGASFWDHNHDGRLDVMVGNFLAFDPAYVSAEAPDMMPHPGEYPGQASMLYEQQEDGSFTEVTEKHGLLYPDSKCMGLSVFDYDLDGDLDIFQANDHQKNFLFRNDGDKYSEVGVASGIATNSNGQVTGSMHATLGDVDGDGLVDILVTDLKYGALYKNLGNGLYQDVTASSGIAGPMKGKGCWGAAFVDYDNDGDLDLVTANGTAEELILQYPLLLQNDGTGRFTDVGKQSGEYFRTKRSGRGLAILDYDNDGDVDIVISHVDLEAAPALLRNDSNNMNHWLGITLQGPEGLSSGIGARVSVFTEGKKQVAVQQWSMGYLSNNDPRMHLGLGGAKSIEKLEVVWPGGSKQTFENLEADQYITIDKTNGIISP
jgi:hypothetical protein